MRSAGSIEAAEVSSQSVTMGGYSPSGGHSVFLPGGEPPQFSAPARAPLISRLRHLVRLTYCPTGGNPQGDLVLRFVRLLLVCNGGGTLTEFVYDESGVVTASTRAAQMLRLSLPTVQQLVKAHPRCTCFLSTIVLISI